MLDTLLYNESGNKVKRRDRNEQKLTQWTQNKYLFIYHDSKRVKSWLKLATPEPHIKQTRRKVQPWNSTRDRRWRGWLANSFVRLLCSMKHVVIASRVDSVLFRPLILCTFEPAVPVIFTSHVSTYRSLGGVPSYV